MNNQFLVGMGWLVLALAIFSFTSTQVEADHLCHQQCDSEPDTFDLTHRSCAQDCQPEPPSCSVVFYCNEHDNVERRNSDCTTLLWDECGGNGCTAGQCNDPPTCTVTTQCSNGDIWRRNADCSEQKLQECGSVGCSSSTNACNPSPTCTPRNICQNNDVYSQDSSCATSFVQDCGALGCTAGACNSPTCSVTNFCSNNDVYQRRSDCSEIKIEECGNIGCNPTTNACNEQCSVSTYCSSNGLEVLRTNADCTTSIVDQCIYGCSNNECNPPPPPTADLTVDDSTVFVGQTFTLFWSGSPSASCLGQDDRGNAFTNHFTGSLQLSPTFPGTTTYTFSCTHDGGSAEDSLIVTVSSSECVPGKTEVESCITNNCFIGERSALCSDQGVYDFGACYVKGPSICDPSDSCDGFGGCITGPTCTVTQWDKVPSELCEGISYTRTNNCGGQEQIVGTKTTGECAPQEPKGGLDQGCRPNVPYCDPGLKCENSIQVTGGSIVGGVCRMVPPTITSFQFSPAAIQQGEPLHVSWAAANANSCQLSGSGVLYALDPNGAFNFVPESSGTLTLICTGSFNQQASKLLSYQVQDPTSSCIDNDGDGYGENCVRGDDCNDNDVRLTTSCNHCGNFVVENNEECDEGSLGFSTVQQCGEYGNVPFVACTSTCEIHTAPVCPTCGDGICQDIESSASCQTDCGNGAGNPSLFDNICTPSEFSCVIDDAGTLPKAWLEWTGATEGLVLEFCREDEVICSTTESVTSPYTTTPQITTIDEPSFTNFLKVRYTSPDSCTQETSDWIFCSRPGPDYFIKSVSSEERPTNELTTIRVTLDNKNSLGGSRDSKLFIEWGDSVKEAIDIPEENIGDELITLTHAYKEQGVYLVRLTLFADSETNPQDNTHSLSVTITERTELYDNECGPGSCGSETCGEGQYCNVETDDAGNILSSSCVFDSQICAATCQSILDNQVDQYNPSPVSCTKINRESATLLTIEHASIIPNGAYQYMYDTSADFSNAKTVSESSSDPLISKLSIENQGSDALYLRSRLLDSDICNSPTQWSDVITCSAPTCEEPKLHECIILHDPNADSYPLTISHDFPEEVRIVRFDICDEEQCVKSDSVRSEYSDYQPKHTMLLDLPFKPTQVRARVYPSIGSQCEVRGTIRYVDPIPCTEHSPVEVSPDRITPNSRIVASIKTEGDADYTARLFITEQEVLSKALYDDGLHGDPAQVAPDGIAANSFSLVGLRPREYPVDVVRDGVIVSSTLIKVEHPGSCIEVIPGHNVIGDGRANIVFHSFSDSPGLEPRVPGLIEGILGVGKSNGGIFTQEPFKSNLDRFNFYYDPRVTPSYRAECKNTDVACKLDQNDCHKHWRECLDHSQAKFESCSFSNQYNFALIDKAFRPHAPSNDVQLSVDKNFLAGVFGFTISKSATHEFGHSFGDLADEYDESVEESTKQSIRERRLDGVESNIFDGSFEGCMDRISEYVGYGCGEDGVIDCIVDYDPSSSPPCNGVGDYSRQCALETACFEGVRGFEDNVYRFTYNNIMRSSRDAVRNTDRGFGAINEVLICEKIRDVTGRAGGICDDYGVST